jgi:hypothetical protein
MDNLTKGVQPDRSKINMSEDFEVRYWTKALGVDRAALQKAVDKVGNTPPQSARSWEFSAGGPNQMPAPKCPICFGIGWVCENHPKRAWTEALGCQCGAGMPCQCVRADGLEEGDCTQIFDERPLARS